jgi:hypothetical protein
VLEDRDRERQIESESKIIKAGREGKGKRKE